MKKVISTSAILIPDGANKVFEGAIFDVYQWPQKMFDDSTVMYEMLKRPDTVQVVAINDGKIALIEEQQPGRPMQLHLPGGRADEDPDWLTAAKRELKEETGYTFKTWKQLTANQPIAKIEWFTPIFLATDVDEVFPQALDKGGEKIVVHWENFEDARRKVLDGHYTMMSYLMSLFARIQSLEELLALPEFQGQEVDR